MRAPSGGNLQFESLRFLNMLLHIWIEDLSFGGKYWRNDMDVFEEVYWGAIQGSIQDNFTRKYTIFIHDIVFPCELNLKWPLSYFASATFNYFSH